MDGLTSHEITLVWD